MIEINTIPTAELNVSKVAVSLNSAQEFGMQFSVVGWGKFKNAEGEDVWGTNPLVSTLLNVTGEAWDAWGSDKDDATYIGDLALSQLGLQRDPDAVIEVEETPVVAPAEESDNAEEASDDSEETTEEAAE
tara:strand:- start:501 stop:890 length:390 start_codon:yes stop_codon:yes gene_type:complete